MLAGLIKFYEVLLVVCKLDSKENHSCFSLLAAVQHILNHLAFVHRNSEMKSKRDQMPAYLAQLVRNGELLTLSPKELPYPCLPSTSTVSGLLRESSMIRITHRQSTQCFPWDSCLCLWLVYFHSHIPYNHWREHIHCCTWRSLRFQSLGLFPAS